MDSWEDFFLKQQQQNFGVLLNFVFMMMIVMTISILPNNQISHDQQNTSSPLLLKQLTLFIQNHHHGYVSYAVYENEGKMKKMGESTYALLLPVVTKHKA